MSHVGVSGSAGFSCPSASTGQRRTLSGFSDRQLLSRVKDLVARERAATLEILIHLNEIERRRLHLGLGYSSMFEYCTRHLGYSSSAASRRIQSARCVRNYPEIYGLLEKNEINLVTISLVASILTNGSARDVIGKIRGKSQREVEAIVATYRPPVSMRDRVKPVCVVVSTSNRSPLSGSPGELTPTAGSGKRPNVAAADGDGGQSQNSTETQALRQATTQLSDVHPTPRLEAKFFVQFLASPRFVQKLERAKALLSNTNGGLSHEFVLEAALDEFLKDHDPDERQHRRKERKEKAEAGTKSGERAATESARSDAAGQTPEAGCGQVDDPSFRRWIGDLPTSRAPAEGGAPRCIPAATRDAVFVRDKGCCTYIGANGERGAATHHLEIDHIVPHARGGTNSIHNLRLFCERHNKHEAQRVLGANVVRRFRRRE